MDTKTSRALLVSKKIAALCESKETMGWKGQVLLSALHAHHRHILLDGRALPGCTPHVAHHNATDAKLSQHAVIGSPACVCEARQSSCRKRSGTEVVGF